MIWGFEHCQDACKISQLLDFHPCFYRYSSTSTVFPCSCFNFHVSDHIFPFLVIPPGCHIVPPTIFFHLISCFSYFVVYFSIFLSGVLSSSLPPLSQSPLACSIFLLLSSYIFSPSVTQSYLIVLYPSSQEWT